LFDQSQLPACMFHDDFKLFGIHVYLRRHETLACPLDNKPVMETTSRRPYFIDNDNEEIDVQDNYNRVNISRDESFNSMDIRDSPHKPQPSPANDCSTVNYSSWILFTSVILLFIGIFR